MIAWHDGQNVDQSFITGVQGPGGLTVDADHIYWTNFDTVTIGRADLNGHADRRCEAEGPRGAPGGLKEVILPKRNEGDLDDVP